MKLPLFLFIALACLWSVGPVMAEEERSLRAIHLESTSRSPKPAKPGAAMDLSAGPTVASSAACCLKQCAGGGSCGQNCQVVDSLSQCGAVNFKFECPANKGMTCVGSSCSCE